MYSVKLIQAAAIRLKNFGQTTGYPPILCDYSNELFLKWKQVEQKMLQIGVIGATDAVIGLLWALTADKYACMCLHPVLSISDTRTLDLCQRMRMNT